MNKVSPEYAEIKALADKQNNPLGSAVGLVSQLNESKIMAAKTSFTERTLRVATDLFDGHLQKIGFLDLKACFQFVEENTGSKLLL